MKDLLKKVYLAKIYFIKYKEMFWNELKNFSKNNWWVYLLLAVSLAIVYVTWKWNIIEIRVKIKFQLKWYIAQILLLFAV